MAEKTFSKAPMSAQGESVKAFMATYNYAGSYVFSIVAPTMEKLEWACRRCTGLEFDPEEVEEVCVFQAKDCEADS